MSKLFYPQQKKKKKNFSTHLIEDWVGSTIGPDAEEKISPTSRELTPVFLAI
jgi:hypothetical protein